MKNFRGIFVLSCRRIAGYITIIFLAALTGCKHTSNHQLAEAERMMDSHPDSSLAVLNSIKTSNLTDKADMALFGLLTIQAMDKCNLFPTNDSLISFSEDYFCNNGDILNTVKSHYYMGRVSYHTGKNSMALVAFVKAKQLAEKTGHHFWAGLACRGISDIYCDTYNKVDELLYAKQEYSHFKECGKQPYLNYALLDLARALYNNQDTKMSGQICQQLLDSALFTNDNHLFTSALQLQSINLIQERKYHEASHTIEEILKNGLANSTDSLNLCEVLCEIGKHKEAEQLLNLVSDGDEAMKTKLRYEIARQSHKFEKALYLLERLDSITNSSFETSVSHDLSSSLANYFGIRKQLDDMKIHNAHVEIAIIVTSSLLLLILVCSLFIYLYRLQNKKISEKVVFAEHITEALEATRKEKKSADEAIRSLLSEKYKMLDDLCYIVITNNDSKTARRKVADAVTKTIDELSVRSDKIVELERKVDSLYSNVFSDFKQDFPNLKEADYRLFLFSVTGIASATISLLLKEGKINAVYERKRRIKDKIKHLDKDKQEKYLKYMH